MLTVAEGLGMHPLQAYCHCGPSTLNAQMGRCEDVHSELSAALALYRAMDMRFWTPQAEAALTAVEGW